MDALRRENARLVEKLRTSEAYNAGMNARAKEMSERLRRMEGEKVRVSWLLLDSYSSSANHDAILLAADPARRRRIRGGRNSTSRRATSTPAGAPRGTAPKSIGWDRRWRA